MEPDFITIQTACAIIGGDKPISEPTFYRRFRDLIEHPTRAHLASGVPSSSSDLTEGANDPCPTTNEPPTDAGSAALVTIEAAKLDGARHIKFGKGEQLDLEDAIAAAPPPS